MSWRKTKRKRDEGQQDQESPRGEFSSERSPRGPPKTSESFSCCDLVFVTSVPLGGFRRHSRKKISSRRLSLLLPLIVLPFLFSNELFRNDGSAQTQSTMGKEGQRPYNARQSLDSEEARQLKSEFTFAQQWAQLTRIVENSPSYRPKLRKSLKRLKRDSKCRTDSQSDRNLHGSRFWSAHRQTNIYNKAKTDKCFLKARHSDTDETELHFDECIKTNDGVHNIFNNQKEYTHDKFVRDVRELLLS